MFAYTYEATYRISFPKPKNINLIPDFFLYLFLAASFIQISYLMVFIKGFSRYKETPPSIASTPISLIVCARNELANLQRLLPLLFQQKHPTYEVIIINDRSDDGTYEFLQETIKTQPLLSVVTVNHLPDHVNGKKYGLTLGIKKAKYDTLLLTDADCYPNSDQWVANMASSFTPSTEIVLGISVYEKTKGLLNAFIRYETLWTALQYIGLALMGKPYMGVGRNLAYKKSLFLNNKGFNGYIHTTGGDDDLFVNQHATAKNTCVCLATDALTYSHPKTTWRIFFRQKIRHLAAGKRYKTSDKIILGVLLLSHTLFWLILPYLFIVNIASYLVVGIFTIRTVALYIAFTRLCKKANIEFDWWALILLDFGFMIYYLATSSTALFTKRVRWT